jgi:probable rRNA maturation factor
VVEEGSRRPIAKGLGRWLSRIAPRSARGTLAIAILPDKKVRELNRKYRDKDRPTDVLSFPATGEVFPGDGGKSVPTPFLGDIAISRGIARKQAKLLGHAPATEVRVLALHGLLHLLGYDHDSDGGRMAQVEARLRRKAGLPSGLIARAATPRVERMLKPRHKAAPPPTGSQRVLGPRDKGRDTA